MQVLGAEEGGRSAFAVSWISGKRARFLSRGCWRVELRAELARCHFGGMHMHRMQSLHVHIYALPLAGLAPLHNRPR